MSDAKPDILELAKRARELAEKSPGPWEAKREDNTDRGWCVYGEDGMLVARRLSEPRARLIEAAPKLLRALASAVETLTRERDDALGDAAAEAAIAVSYKIAAEAAQARLAKVERELAEADRVIWTNAEGIEVTDAFTAALRRHAARAATKEE